MTTTRANAARAKQLLRIAADASKQLEESVRELVTMRAWEVLGYENFSEMWEKENGFPWPIQVQCIAVGALHSPDRDSLAVLDEVVSLGISRSNAVWWHPATGMLRLIHGHELADDGRFDGPEPAARVHPDDDSAAQSRRLTAIRSRPQPRRMGKAPDEKVSTSISPERWLDDEIAEIARKADVPKTEIYCQAAAEFVARHRASRPVTFSGAAS